MADEGAPQPETPPAAPTPAPAASPAPAGGAESLHPVNQAGILKEDEAPHKVIIRPYPSIIYLYPTILVALVCGLGSLFTMDSVNLGDGSVKLPSGIETSTVYPIEAQASLFGLLFIGVLAFNLSVLAFDFTRAAFVALIFFFAFIGVGGWLLESQTGAITKLAGIVGSFHFYANPQFYFGVFVILSLIFGGVFIQTRFDYWELQHNELLHHRGLVGDVERFSAHYVRWTKEIPDVFEYCLLLSGRLVLYVREREKPIVLPNVLNINRLELRMAKIQSTMHVKVDTH